MANKVVAGAAEAAFGGLKMSGAEPLLEAHRGNAVAQAQGVCEERKRKV
jgi:hypothetical protein